MSARYFTANVHQSQVIVLSGPHPTHDAAMQPHVDRLAAGGAVSGHWTPTVLLDPASLVGLSEQELATVLLTDPALAALWHVAARAGAADAWARAETGRTVPDPPQVTEWAASEKEPPHPIPLIASEQGPLL